jgi:hypothetical protein
MKRNIVRLYEQNASIERIGQYCKNRSRWVSSMINDEFDWKAEFKLADRDVYKLAIRDNLSIIQGYRN